MHLLFIVFLLSEPLALHIPALTMNSQHRQVKQPVAAEAAFILITARGKAFNKGNFV